MTTARLRRGWTPTRLIGDADDVLESGRVAFYSHRETNVASAGVARTLGLVEWYRSLSI